MTSITVQWPSDSSQLGNTWSSFDRHPGSCKTDRVCHVFFRGFWCTPFFFPQLYSTPNMLQTYAQTKMGPIKWGFERLSLDLCCCYCNLPAVLWCSLLVTSFSFLLGGPINSGSSVLFVPVCLEKPFLLSKLHCRCSFFHSVIHSLHRGFWQNNRTHAVAETFTLPVFLFGRTTKLSKQYKVLLLQFWNLAIGGSIFWLSEGGTGVLLLIVSFQGARHQCTVVRTFCIIFKGIFFCQRAIGSEL